MASCEHLCHAEEQLRDLLTAVNDHMRLYEPDEEPYGSLLAVAGHINEALRELSYLLDQADEAEGNGLAKEVGH